MSRAGQDRRWRGLGAVLLGLAAFGLALAVAVTLYVRRERARVEVLELERAARALAADGSPAGLGRASEALAAALARHPEAPALHALAARVDLERALTLGVAEAEAAARAHLARAGSGGEARWTRAWLDVRAGRGAAVLAGLEADATRGPDAHLARARALAALGRRADAYAAYAEAADAGWPELRFSLAAARAALEDGRSAEALTHAARVLDRAPEHPVARVALAHAAASAGVRLEEAARAADAALAQPAALTPGLQAWALAARAEVLRAEGRPAAAREAAEAALRRVPEHPLALLARGLALAEQRDAEARVALEAAARRLPGSALVALGGARALASAGERAGALALLDGYAGALPSEALAADGRYWRARGDLMREGGALDEALAAYARAVTAGGEEAGRARVGQAEVLLARGDHDGARALLLPLAPADGRNAVPEAYPLLRRLQASAPAP